VVSLKMRLSVMTSSVVSKVLILSIAGIRLPPRAVVSIFAQEINKNSEANTNKKEADLFLFT
jgi:hypothetical protein